MKSCSKEELSLDLDALNDLLHLLKSKRHKKHHKKHDKCNGVISNCEGCACSQLSDAMMGDTFQIILEGTAEFLALGPGMSPGPTQFSFVNFNPENCCATFRFTEPSIGTQTLILDCRCICALTPVNGTPPGPGTPPVTPPVTPGSLRARLLELVGELVQIEVGNELFNPLVGTLLAVRDDYIVLLETTGVQTLVRMTQIETLTEL